MMKVIQSLKLIFSKNKTLTLALLISLLLHSFLLTRFSISLPELDKHHQVLEVRLTNVQAMQKSGAAPVIPNTAIPQTVKTTETTPKLQTKTTLPPIAKAPINTEKPALALHPEATLPINQPVEPDPSEQSPADLIEAANITKLNNLASQTKPQVYNYVEIEFDVIRGGDAAAAGVTHMQYSVQDNNTYELTSVTTAKEGASVLPATLHLKSEGTLSEKGLRPSYYQYQWGNDDKYNQSAILAWSDGVVVMRSAKGEKIEPLVEGTQDALSFMVQFMFSPLAVNNEITIANGQNLRTDTYLFQDQVLLQTKIGELRTAHLLKDGKEEGKTELWLALDYQNLPVKIRKTEIGGSFIEQIATKINTLKR
jgi:hypothetical protein